MSAGKTDPRHYARIIVLQRLFERAFVHFELNTNSKDEFDYQTLSEIDEISDFDAKLADRIFEGVVAKREEIDDIIKKLAPQWPIEQIAKTDLQILRMAIYEGFLTDITPERVAIDEAIELSKEFANEQSRKFINGVLGSLIERKQEFIKN